MTVAYKVDEIHLYDNTHNECIAPITLDDSLPAVLTIAGSDSSGGAGIEADIKTISAHKCYAMTGIVCLTAQNTTGVIDAAYTDGKVVENMLDQDFKDIKIDAIKTGLLTEESIPKVKDAIVKYNFKGFLVVDPVMVSTSGFDFLNNRVLKLLINTLSQYVTIITPNLIEACCIINTFSGKQIYKEESLKTIDEMYQMCKRIHELTGIENVLVKGGHQRWINSEEMTDVLYASMSDTFTIFHSTVIDSRNTHGTGCTLSSAIASNLALGLSMVNSIANGIVYVQNGIKTSPDKGSGHGPLNHLQLVSQYNYETDVSFQLPFPENGALEYLSNHPDIREGWKVYTNHAFMRRANNRTVPLEVFQRFAVQNVKYLRNYADMILKLASKCERNIELEESVGILNATLTELAAYKKIFQNLPLDFENIESHETSKECKLYMDNLRHVANSGDKFDILVSLAPCVFGFRQASLNAVATGDERMIVDELTEKVCSLWIAQNLSEWYKQGYIASEKKLNEYFLEYCKSEAKLNRIIGIFKLFTEMEIQFLDPFLC